MTIDYVDVSDPALVDWDVGRVLAAGGTPVTLSESRLDSVPMVIDAIIARAGAPQAIDLLRIHAHGAPGSQGVNDSHGYSGFFFNAFDLDYTRDSPEVFGRLRRYFAPNGRVELHGCNVGAGHRGTLLLLRLARIWQVPVSAGIGTQYCAFNFDGAFRTAYPNGRVRRTLNTRHQLVSCD